MIRMEASEIMELCASKCMKEKTSCKEKQCRKWIDFQQDLNCIQIAVKNNGSMTLQEVAKRLKISHVRISQIEKEAIRKLQKKFYKITN